MKRFFAPIIIRVTQAYTKLFPNILKKRTWWPIFLVTIVLIAVVSVLPVHAQFPLEDLLNGLVELVGRILIELSKLCIFLAIFFLRLFITLASYNNYIDVSVVKLGWVMVRDVANMFFIVGLLVIAFATILGLESYEWKKGVVKIVLMAILINFSNLIAQLIIDVAHIFTITFLNAVSATAGGNLITLFQLDNILKLTAGAPNEFGDTRQVASLTLFAGSALAFVFALLAALSIGAYLIVMIARIVVLWALIILSPLAFMLYALPQGEDYAKQWWSEFSKHVIVAPIMVFFLWLAFATFGTGQVINEIQSGENVIQINATGEAETVGKQSVSILEISTWENLASFLLGIAFLWVGIKKTEETGAMGSGLVGNAIDFTKNVATIATGYAAGRWIVGKGVEKGKDFGIARGQDLRLGYNKALDKTGKFGKAVRAPGKFFKSRKIAREKAIEQLDKRNEDWAHEAHAKADHWLAPDKDSRAKQSIAAHEAERKEKAIYSRVEAQISLENLKHEEKHYDDVYKDLITEAEKKREKPLTDDEKEDEYRKGMEGKILNDEIEKRRKEEFSDEQRYAALDVARKEKGEDLTAEEANKAVETARNKITLSEDEQIGIINEVRSGKRTLSDTQKKEIEQEVVKKRASSAVSEKERAALRRKAAEMVGGEIDIIALENEAKRPLNKYAVEQGRVAAGIVDEQRIQEGKKRKAVRIFQMKEAQEDQEDYKDYLYDEHMGEAEQNFNHIREINKERARRARTKEPISDQKLQEEKEIYKNAVQAQGRNLSSMYGKNYGKFLRDKLVGMDQTFSKVDFNNPNSRHILDLALLSGKSLSDFTVKNSKGQDIHDVSDEEVGDKVRQKHAQIAASVGVDLKDKKGVIMRGLMVAHDKAAYEHNNVEATHGFSVGRDQHGDEIVAPTATMGSGQFASGGDLFSTGDSRKGHQRIKDKIDFYLSDKSIDKIDAGSIGNGGVTTGVRILDSKGETKSVQLLQRFANKAIVELVEQIGNKAASEIARMPRALINSVLGGQVDQSSFDNSAKKFLVANEDMRRDIGTLFERFQMNYSTAETDTTRDNVKKSIRVFLESAGVQGDNIDELVKKIAISEEAYKAGARLNLDSILKDVSKPDTSTSTS